MIPERGLSALVIIKHNCSIAFPLLYSSAYLIARVSTFYKDMKIEVDRNKSRVYSRPPCTFFLEL